MAARRTIGAVRLDRPVLVYDGECAFCRAWIARWRNVVGDRLDFAPFQEAAARFPAIARERFAAAVQLIEPGGRVSEGAEAVFRALALAPGRGGPLALYRHVPGVAAITEAIYRGVARHRGAMHRLTRAVWGPHVVPTGHTATAWLFLRLLGVTYLIAFVSLWVQIMGLAGSGGILPAREYLALWREHYGAAAAWSLPTLCWWNASDAFLHVLCAAGTLAAALLAVGLVPALATAACWLFYLSVSVVCQDFLWFQWDSLLLETGLIAILLAPVVWRSTPRRDAPPSGAALWVVRWLLFRLMFSSAVVKLASGDPTWRDLSALTYHYETQPLPPWTAWYMHHLPAWCHRASAVGVFAIEGVAPFLMVFPRRIRFATAWAMVALQLMMIATGNYGFFNLLSIALCVTLLDDGALLRLPEAGASRAPRRPRGAWPKPFVRAAALALFLLGLVPMFRTLRWPTGLLGPVASVERLLSPLRSINSYGLFAVMTTRRPEIVVEGSDDGATWRAYEFRYKPGRLDRRPPFVAPHMPRLDWQMWFAALGDYRQETWFLYFAQRLLEGKPAVRALLEHDPFPGAPPRFLRATVYDYRFTDAATRRSTGAWWRRERRGLYCPVLTLDQGRLMAVPEAGAAANPDSTAAPR